MENGTYIWIAAAGAVLCTALVAFNLRKNGRKTLTAPVALLLGAALGVLLSKVFYLVMTMTSHLSKYGYVVTSPMEWSFFGGLTGVYLGVWLSGKLMKEKSSFLMELFAPVGMLLIFVLRAGECVLQSPLDQLALGELVENEALHFFPVSWAVTMWGRSVYYMAVFAWEAALALLLCGIALFSQRKHGVSKDHRVLSMTLFYVCLGQLLFEQLRSGSIRLGFLRLEQVLCAVVCFAAVLRLCLRYKDSVPVVRFLPAVLILAGIGAVAGLEFALDEPSYQRWAVYMLFVLTLLLMAAVYVWAARRAQKDTKQIK